MLARGWWRRFSLRSLLVLVTLCAIALGVWVSYFQPYYAEREVLSALPQRARIGIEPRGPSWLRDIFDGKYAERVVAVQVSGPTDADLAKLSLLRELRQLTVAGGDEITDAGLAHVGRLSRLERLDLEAPQVSDRGVQHLSRLDHLQSLSLKSSITDDGLTHIGQLTNLRTLDLSCPISDDGMPALLSLQQLEVLRCSTNPNRQATRVELLRMSQYQLVDQPLRDVIDHIRDWHEMPLRFDRAAIQEAGVEPTQPVTAGIYKRLHENLDGMLRPLGLDWCWQGDGLVVTSQEAAAETRRGLTQLEQNLPHLSEVQVDW